MFLTEGLTKSMQLPAQSITLLHSSLVATFGLQQEQCEVCLVRLQLPCAENQESGMNISQGDMQHDRRSSDTDRSWNCEIDACMEKQP